MNKKLIRLTESDLHRIVKESVKKVLKEDYCWWGDTKPLEQIYNAAREIAEWHEDDDDYFEDVDSRAAWDLHVWAKKVADDAESFIHSEAHNTSINGGENW